MKTLIVPTDFSPVSINALHYAAEMANAIDASLLLVHVYQIPVTFSEVPVMAVSIDEMKATSEERLLEMKSSLEHFTSGGLKVYTEAILGDTVDELRLLCDRIQPFALVMGTHGNSGLERMILGSTTLTAIRQLKYPVIAVPPGTTFKGIKKIGLACDFKDVVESTPVNFIKSIVEQFNASLHILNVDYHHEHFTRQTPLESAYLDTMLGYIKPNYHFLNREDIVNGITEFAENNNLDLVMIIPKKHKLLEGIFHRSSSAGLVSHSHIPVVAIHE